MYKEYIKNIINNILINEENTFKKNYLEFHLGLAKPFSSGINIEQNYNFLNDENSLKIIKKIKTIKQELEKRNIKYIFIDYLNDTLTVVCDTHQEDDVISILAKYGLKIKS